ncbi:hypothetical protein [Metabacillus fastidiosus]|uniref:hypothetical protein n=1 Tax=Metabacillus fastidiosus TaxID=1458 RepID=UPI0008246E51|nr:hypothetical protein [Metabacillus fastidiosus]MED4461869.1 hypothetical protein [Metabacillus fastidiosus]
MNIRIVKTSVQFKNPIIGQPTRRIEEHYYARNITAMVDNNEQHFRFTNTELPFLTDEMQMITTIESRLTVENTNKINAE